MVGYRHPVSIAGQILKNALRSAKGRLDVNDPFDLGGFLTQSPERSRLSQRKEFPGEAERALAESSSQLPQELFAEAAAEHAHGKKEGGLWAGDPAGTVERDASSRHDTMQVRVQM